jgi:hypothetical protein
MIACSVCGSPEWITCHPGQAAESRVLEDGVFKLHPAVEVADTAWCKAHWPSHVATKRRSRGRLRRHQAAATGSCNGQ